MRIEVNFQEKIHSLYLGPNLIIRRLLAVPSVQSLKGQTGNIQGGSPRICAYQIVTWTAQNKQIIADEATQLVTGIITYRLSDGGTTWIYELESFTRATGKYLFRDAEGDVYPVWAYVTGPYDFGHNSGSQTIIQGEVC